MLADNANANVTFECVDFTTFICESNNIRASELVTSCLQKDLII